MKVVDEGARSYLSRTDERFDVIQVSLADSFRPVLAGAYGVSENYLYTVEAFESYYRRLAPGGFLSVTRWAQTPPSEESGSSRSPSRPWSAWASNRQTTWPSYAACRPSR